MYILEPVSTAYRKNPWERPYADRILPLKEAREYGRKTAAFLYPHFDSSTFRYRGYNVAETLEYSYWWSGSYFELKDMPQLLKDFDDIDVLVVIRCAWYEELEKYLKVVKEKGIRLCYDVDDLICLPGYMPSVISALGLEQEPEWNFWFGLTERNHLIAEMCDVMITTNEYLAGYLRKDFGKPCYILKNYLNWIQEEISGIYFTKKQELTAEKPFEIGYFSGSPTHLRDIMVIMPELEEFLERHENTVLKIIGHMELPHDYDALIQKRKIRYVPFQTFQGLQYEQAKVDVNVVPLVNNEFSNCKSELKYFESAIVGTITCATPSHAYANAITSGENGYLCQKGEWLPVFEKLYEEGVRKEQQAYIRERALEVYSHKNQIGFVEDLLEAVLEQIPPRISE